MKFIKLTDPVDRTTILINAKDISTAFVTPDGATQIDFISNENESIEVKETPEKIYDLCTSTSA